VLRVFACCSGLVSLVLTVLVVLADLLVIAALDTTTVVVAVVVIVVIFTKTDGRRRCANVELCSWKAGELS
jgi:hypothetical protein